MRVVVLALMAISMSGCGEDSVMGKLGIGSLGGLGEEGKMQEVVRASLKDPDSAKFGKMTRVTDKRACLTVNAKNALGGYTGDQQAYLLKSEDQWEVIYIEDKLSHTDCIEIMSKKD